MTSKLKDERPSSRYSLSFMARLAHIKPFLPSNASVLDVGCGEGLISKILIENGCRVTGIDYSSEAIKKASGLPGEYLQVDFYDYRPGKKFDWIVCSEVLEHLDNDRLALKKMYSWLKPQGKFLLSVPTYLNLTPSLRSVGGHLRHYRPKPLKLMLKRVGFVIEKEKEWGCLIRRIILSCFPGASLGKPESWRELIGRLLGPLIILDTFLCPFPDSIIVIAQKPR